VGAELVHADGQLDKNDEADSRFSQLCERAGKYISFLVQSCIEHRKDTFTFACDKENPLEKWTGGGGGGKKKEKKKIKKKKFVVVISHKIANSGIHLRQLKYPFHIAE